jgi:hypothetical protein
VDKTKKSQLALRLDRLRSATGKTWDALANDLGVKRAMVFHVLSGRRGFSDKTLDRLVECEVAAGVRSQASALIERGLRGSELVTALLEHDTDTDSQVSVHDIDTGSKRIRLEYRRGAPPQGFPAHVTVKAATNSTVWRMLGERGTRENPSNFLAACLPELQDQPDVIERLTPSCYALLLDTALDLTFGLNWRAKLRSEAATQTRKHRQKAES